MGGVGQSKLPNLEEQPEEILELFIFLGSLILFSSLERQLIPAGFIFINKRIGL